MSAANGVGLKKILDDRWEVIEAFGTRYLGRVVAESGDTVSLSPVFAYVSNPQIVPGQQPGQVQLGWQRMVLPIEMMASLATMTLRWSGRYKIADFDSADQAVFEAAVAEAMANQRKLAAARAGLTIVPQMPKLPPAPGGRS